MTEARQLDQAYHFIMASFVRSGQAPHFTEIAREFAMTPEEGKQLLHALINTGRALIPMWLFPDTDLIASFSPFSNLPTQYRISVDGQHKWCAQCGLESLAVCWLFPGKSVRIDAPCLDCGESLSVVVRDGVVARQDPSDVHAYIDIPYRDWRHNMPYT